MGVFADIDLAGHELVLFGQDKASGLKTIIAVHSTTLGPALGGARFFPYETEEEALFDVLRLSQGMTLKNSLAGLDFGGGKAVIIGDFRVDKTEALLEAYGRIVQTLGGRYITAEDVGTAPADVEVIGRQTRWALGTRRRTGGSGDPSPATARGLFGAASAASQYLWDTNDLGGRRVAIQGVGKVGYDYARRLSEAGCEVIVTDMYPPAIDRAVATLGAKAVEPDQIFAVDCDIFAPCAMGGGINDATIPLLNCRAIVGSANNQLLEDDHAQAVADRGILYVPDFVANAGGVINIAVELGGYDIERAAERIDGIYDTVLKVLGTAENEGLLPNEAAIEMAMTRLNGSAAAGSAA